MLKRVDFIGLSLEDIKTFPEEVRSDIGYALFAAQRGKKPEAAKPLRGFGGAGVLEIEDINLIKQRLRIAEEEYNTYYK